MQGSSQNTAGARPRRSWICAVAAVAAAVGGAVLFFLDPAQGDFYPPCLFHKLTGLNCPGCGGLRALHHLLHGHFAQALHCNALVLLALPALPVAWIFSLWRKRADNGQPQPFPKPALIWLFLGVAIAFGILRNLPSPPFACLSP